MGKKQALRKEPRQERGQRRIEKILNAAERVFAKVGYEAATTNAIAQAARTSIGSIYQFFPHKEAILQAVADRFLGQLRALHEELFDHQRLPEDLEECYERIIRTLADFHTAHPAFQALFFGSATSGHLAAANEVLERECICRVEQLFAERMPWMSAADRRLYATINVNATKALLPLSESGDAAFRERVLTEIKRLMLGHMLQIVAEQAPSEPAQPRMP